MKDCSLSPQGDDNPSAALHSSTYSYCSLSPQGDDNMNLAASLTIAVHCSLSPQGDDNFTFLICFFSARIAAYPRKGTIMFRAMFSTALSKDCSLSPQGDDNGYSRSTFKVII